MKQQLQSQHPVLRKQKPRQGFHSIIMCIYAHSGTIICRRTNVMYSDAGVVLMVGMGVGGMGVGGVGMESAPASYLLGSSPNFACCSGEGYFTFIK